MERDLVERDGQMLQQKSLMAANKDLTERRFFNGLVTFMDRPLGKLCFIFELLLTLQLLVSNFTDNFILIRAPILHPRCQERENAHIFEHVLRNRK